MGLKIIANIDVRGNAIAGSKSLIRSINNVNFDSTGNIDIDSYTDDEFNSMISLLPVSNFIAPSTLNYSAYTINFNDEAHVLLSGKTYSLAAQSIDLSTIKTEPSNSTFYVYVELIQGLATYIISQEQKASTYNTLWIGNIITGSTKIDSVNIQNRSRLDIFSPSIDAAGSSFPVSQGYPSGSGTINW